MKKLQILYDQIQASGVSSSLKQVMDLEMQLAKSQGNVELAHFPLTVPSPPMLYDYTDLVQLHGDDAASSVARFSIHSLEYLLARDLQREKDGFPRKIQVGRLVKSGRDGSNKVVVVPTTVEEKFFHDKIHPEQEDESGEGDGSEGGEGGSGEGDVGDVIGEEPVRQDGGDGSGAGKGEGGSHELESNAYDLGKVLTEQFELPNLRDKGKKRSLTRYTYDLTDQNRGFGQILDKKATLRRIVQTNIALGRIHAEQAVNTEELLISPNDRVYRILSKEKDYESQAMVFFVRDYSGSMSGKPTELVVNQHILIYAWLTFQYDRQVETRFILHDTEAREVDNFHTYANLKVAGGTQVVSAYKMVNGIVEEEGLAKDYNIYVFHGTDGDDWDSAGEKSIPELKRMLRYASRVGITVAENSFGMTGQSEVEGYVRKSGLLESADELLRLDVLPRESNETRIIEGIKKLIS